MKSADVYRSPLDSDEKTAKNLFAFNGCLIVPPFHDGLNPSLPATREARR